jgi:hypothetical protein
MSRYDCEWCGYGLRCACTPGHRSTAADFDPETDLEDVEPLTPPED